MAQKHKKITILVLIPSNSSAQKALWDCLERLILGGMYDPRIIKYVYKSIIYMYILIHLVPSLTGFV